MLYLAILSHTLKLQFMANDQQKPAHPHEGPPGQNKPQGEPATPGTPQPPGQEKQPKPEHPIARPPEQGEPQAQPEPKKG
jgi:hypothetical protein